MNCLPQEGGRTCEKDKPVSRPVYRGTDRHVRDYARGMESYLREIEEQGAQSGTGPAPEQPPRPAFNVVELTGIAATVTLLAGQLNALYIVKNTAAHDFVLPVLGTGMWVQVLNDSGSVGAITIKDSDLNVIATLAAGAASGVIVADITGLEAPL